MKIHNPHITPQILPQPPGSKKNACPSNPLNLPTSINFYSANKKIDYIYTATGQKTQQKTINNGRVENRRQYAGSFVFKNRRLSYATSIAGRFLYVDDGRSSPRFENEIALKDHLGNTRVTLDHTGNPTQQIDYYPFGHMIYASDTQTPFAEDNRYLYNGKELQDDFGLDWYDYGARFYDGQIGRFHTQDRFAEDFAEWSPYHYANNNPVLNIDINGDSTFVTMSDNGTYVVTGGNLDNEDDKGVYMMGEDGQYVKVGESVTSHSFFDEDGNAVEGAVIDPNSTEGQDFIDGLIKDDPSLLVYMYYARNGQKYDLKEEDIKKRPEGMSRQQYRYRGSVTYNGEFGSARDFGNMGAGIVAGRKGLSWGASRIGFDAYQSYKSGKLDFEGIPTQKAQRIGHYIGKGLLLNEIKRKH